jgi:hypothetical protein
MGYTWGTPSNGVENEVEKNQAFLSETANSAIKLFERVQKEKAELEEKHNKLVEEHDKAIKILELAKSFA